MWVDYISIGIIGFVVVAAFLSLAQAIIHHRHWDYLAHNPYRRVCKKCNQQQDYYDPSGWQNMYPIIRKPCRWHGDD